jgi:MFS family permease
MSINGQSSAKREMVLIWIMAFSAFMVYTSMYGIRKPYTAGAYTGLTQFGISYKVVLVTAQVIGYMISKFIGIRFIAEIDRTKRKQYILQLIGVGWVSLFLFAIVPFEYKFICMFLNGLPLGMIWGLVFSYLEGRKMTDFLGSFLSITFILSSGLAKTVGSLILKIPGINEFWMPFVTGGIFIFPLLLFSYILDQSPAPNEIDKIHRTERKSMDKAERKKFLSEFGFLIVPAVITYALLTIIRDFSEDFSADLWREAGKSNNSFVFTQSSLITSFLVIGTLSLFYKIQNNFKAFIGLHILVIAGFILSIISTILFSYHIINIFTWMVAATTGLYMGYVAKNCLYYERMIASFKIKGNVGFVMYIADAFGYLGTVLVLLLKEFVTLEMHWESFFKWVFYIASSLGIVLIIITLSGFIKKFNRIANE